MLEAEFLNAIASEPNSDAARLVYADWLEERGDPLAAQKAEFLRQTVAVHSQKESRGQKKARRRRLQELAAKLDTDWLVVVSRLRVENCRALHSFDLICDRRWEDLQPTTKPNQRFCDGCKHNVHYCATIMDARKQAQQRHCIAVDIGVIRRERDLEPRRMVVGRPSPDYYRQEEERLKPDAVSAERQRRRERANADRGIIGDAETSPRGSTLVPTLIDVRDAQTRLAELLTLAANGQEIVLTENAVPRARLVAIVAAVTSERVPGLHAGAIQTTADFDEPLGDEFWCGTP